MRSSDGSLVIAFKRKYKQARSYISRVLHDLVLDPTKILSQQKLQALKMLPQQISGFWKQCFPA
jgi:hypothetical protein